MQQCQPLSSRAACPAAHTLRCARARLPTVPTTNHCPPTHPPTREAAVQVPLQQRAHIGGHDSGGGQQCQCLHQRQLLLAQAQQLLAHGPHLRGGDVDGGSSMGTGSSEDCSEVPAG